MKASGKKTQQFQPPGNCLSIWTDTGVQVQGRIQDLDKGGSLAVSKGVKSGLAGPADDLFILQRQTTG